MLWNTVDEVIILGIILDLSSFPEFNGKRISDEMETQMSHIGERQNWNVEIESDKDICIENSWLFRRGGINSPPPYPFKFRMWLDREKMGMTETPDSMNGMIHPW